jgi:hypothetical protein
MELEYKILQSQTPHFSDPAKMQAVLAEEAKAGWRLLEKEDNFRIKLQRDISHRENDKNLDFDAYRSTVGVPAIMTYALSAAITIAIVSTIIWFALGTTG